MKELVKFKIAKDGKPVDFVLAEPSRSIVKDAELLYAKTYAEGVRNGLLTDAEAIKQSEERGGVFTPEEKEEYADTLKKYFETEKKLSDAKEKGEDTKQLEIDVAGLRDKLRTFQMRQDSIFNLTAETRARESVAFHYALALTQQDGKTFFEGVNFESRMKKFDEKVDDTFVQTVYSAAVWYATAYQMGVRDLNSVPYPGQYEDKPKAEKAKKE